MKVSILVMTYNHINFIGQALDSVLMQQVDFDCEILISEDCSTDGTREVVQNYYERFPDQIRLLLSEKNVRSNQVVARGIRAAQGQYIALLDGDDYWTSPDKLQKQVDFLDTHPECAICFHNARVFYEDGRQEPRDWTPPNQKPISTLEDIWLGNFIATCSTMFRRGLFGELPVWYEAMFPITDWPLHILNAEHGKIGYLNEIMGAYRFHRGGCYSAFSESQKLDETMKFYKTMNANLGFKYDRMIKGVLSKYFFEWTEEYLKRGDFGQARRCFKAYLSGRPLNSFIPMKKLAKFFLLLYIFPIGSVKRSHKRRSSFSP